MAKAKFTLAVSPTFKATVQIPRAGAESGDIEFTFKHRDRVGINELLDSVGAGDVVHVDLILDVASGWDLDSPFDAANIKELDRLYYGAVRAIFNTYIAELQGTRAKN